MKGIYECEEVAILQRLKGTFNQKSRNSKKKPKNHCKKSYPLTTVTMNSRGKDIHSLICIVCAVVKGGDYAFNSLQSIHQDVY